MFKYKNFVLVVSLVLLLSAVTFAQPEQTVIAPDLTGQELHDFIINEYKTSNTLGYDYGRDIMYGEIDLLPGDSLRGVYSGFTIYLNLDYDPSTDAYNKGINAEHTWPQSMGAGDEPQKSDLHHLFPAKDNVNSARGNRPFREIPDNETDTWYWKTISTSSIPTSHIDEYSEVGNGVFEPREDHKGNAARAVFYFYAMYTGPANDNFFDIQKDVLLDWSYLDPVDQIEYDRTYAIADYQDNKPNPFVLDSTLARRIWFTGVTPPPEPDTLLFTDSFEEDADDWTIYNGSGNHLWERNSETAAEGNYAMHINGWSDNTTSDDWLISPEVSLTGLETVYLYYAHYYDYSGPAVQVKVSTDYTSGDPAGAAWTLLNENSPAISEHWEYQSLNLSDYLDQSVRIAFHYTSTGTGSGDAALWRIDDVQFQGTLPGPEYPALVISEVADPQDNYNARFVELYNASDEFIDLGADSWNLVRQANGSSTSSIQLSGAIGPGEYFTIAYNIDAFTSAYGMSPNMGGVAVSGNGDDGYYLFYGGNEEFGELVDAYGVFDEDGSGTAWEYEDGHASRYDFIAAPSAEWIAAEWEIEAPATTAMMTPGSPITSVEDHFSEIPPEFTVHPAYPNPFNPATTVSFELPSTSDVTIIVYNLLGKEVFSRHMQSIHAGRHTSRIELSESTSGMYFLRVATPESYYTQKILLVK